MQSDLGGLSTNVKSAAHNLGGDTRRMRTGAYCISNPGVGIPPGAPEFRKWRTVEAHLGDAAGHLTAHHEALNEGPCGDEGLGDPGLQLLGRVPEGPELLAVLVQTLQVVLAEAVLRVQHLKNALQQPRPEVVEHLVHVDVAAGVVALQLPEELLEDLGILLVEQAVGIQPGRSLVEILLYNSDLAGTGSST
ncbi:hypothetical protein N1851_024244 [Merluccius polli]|uniref:Uncharacterized protein n=1 Tax=Merluccius polli TaxID=89951 RepID=A0AA47MF81_MERPO|nr:hypothetical protein N1851_024244 [Merluccius polli]